MKRIITILLVAIMASISAGYAQMRTKPLSEMTKSEKKAYLKWLESEIATKQDVIAYYESKKQLSEEEQKQLAAYRQATKELSSITEEVEEAIREDEWWEQEQERIKQALTTSLQGDLSKMPSLAQMQQDAKKLSTIDFLIKYDPYYLTFDPVKFQSLSLAEKKAKYKLQEKAVFKARKEIYQYEQEQTSILYDLQNQIYQKIEFYPQLDASTLAPDSKSSDVVKQVNSQLIKGGFEPLSTEEKAYIVNSTKEAETKYVVLEDKKLKTQEEEKKLKDVWDIIKVECPECAQQKK